MKEYDLERTVEHYLTAETKRRGGMSIKLTSPGNSGIPDRLILLPGYMPYFIELKAPGKKPRPLQLAFMKKMADVGCRCGIEWFDSIDKIDAFMWHYDVHKEMGDCNYKKEKR